eukprot:TRINITY_DN2972_c0_g1_i2.p1 TRINITY_DN2972_c0_g1~~TRINITY_DN2972_c0_g1_i2.p1  ORF type:complete len:149 (+),score=58.96 TRINITY_DN2972_c0_g1_i2:66-512(+)
MCIRDRYQRRVHGIFISRKSFVMESLRLGFEIALKNKLAQKTSSLQSEETLLMKCFKYFDTDNDGYLSMNEWFKSIEKIGVVVPTLEDLKQLFLCYDASREGKIECKAFCDCIFRHSTIKPVSQQVACLLYTSPSPRDLSTSRMPSSA